MHANIYVYIRILIAEFPAYEIERIDKLQSHCANMNVSDKSIYNRIFEQVTHKGGEYEINYNNIFQNAQALSVFVENPYSEDQKMHTFLDNFHQVGKYSDQISSHQAELRREEIYRSKIFIYFTLTDYLYKSVKQIRFWTK